MKNFTLLLIFTFSISLLSAQNKDEEAIKKVVLAETDNYINRDAKAWTDLYVKSPQTTIILTPNNAPGAVAVMSDYDKFSKGMEANMKANAQSEMQVTKRDNFNIRINGNMAWSTHDQYNVMVKTGAKIKSKELKVLEKIDGEWKISLGSSTWNFLRTEYDIPNLEEEAIKAVIIQQFEAFRDGDFEKWADVYIHEPYLTWSVTNGGEPGDVLTARGWEELKGIMQKGLEAKAKAPKTVNTTKVSRDKWNIQIRGNLAYVNYNQRSENEEKQTKLESTEMRILEKVKGVWKITTQATLADFKDATPPIRTKY